MPRASFRRHWHYHMLVCSSCDFSLEFACDYYDLRVLVCSSYSFSFKFVYNFSFKFTTSASSLSFVGFGPKLSAMGFFDAQCYHLQSCHQCLSEGLCLAAGLCSSLGDAEDVAVLFVATYTATISARERTLLWQLACGLLKVCCFGAECHHLQCCHQCFAKGSQWRLAFGLIAVML